MVEQLKLKVQSCNFRYFQNKVIVNIVGGIHKMKMNPVFSELNSRVYRPSIVLKPTKRFGVFTLG